MANRYWVGGTATWSNGVVVGNWATTSGGAPGAADPSYGDDVFFDAASGAVTVTISSAIFGNYNIANSVDFTGFTGTANFANTKLELRGGLILASTMAVTTSGTNAFFFDSQSVQTVTINFAGFDITGTGSPYTASILIGGQFSSGTIFNIVGDCPGTKSNFTCANGTINLGSSEISCYKFVAQQNWGFTTTLNMGSSTINTIDLKIDYLDTQSITLNCGTSTINGTRNFATNPNVNYVFNDVYLSGASAIEDSCTFNNLYVNTAGDATGLRIQAGTTQTITGLLSTNGSTGNLAKMWSSSAGTAFTLTKSAGINSVEYMSIKDSTATGGAFWAAKDSDNVSGNTGWVFTVASPSLSPSATPSSTPSPSASPSSTPSPSPSPAWGIKVGRADVDVKTATGIDLFFDTEELRANGTFLTSDSKIIVVKNGIITSIQFSSPSVSPSVSTSLSPSVSISLSPSVSVSLSPSVSPSISVSLSPSLSPSISISLSPSSSPSTSESASPSASPSI